LAGWLALRAASAAPAVSCAEPVLDFGERNIELPVDHVFVLENKGDADLVISEVRPGCPSCTVAKADPPVVPPGGTSKVAVRLQLGGFRGAITKQLYVFSNDPVTPRLQLTLRGIAATEIVLTPETLSFPSIPVGGSVTGTVQIACATTNRMVVTHLVPGDSFVSASVKPVEEGRKYEISVVVRGNPPPGQASKPGGMAQVLESHVVIHLDHPTQKALPLTLRGFLREKVQVAPNLVPLALNSNPATVRHLTVSFEPRPDFRITAVEWPEGTVEFAWTPMGEGRGRLSLSKFTVKPEFHGKTVLIRTNMPGKEELRVPIHVFQNPTPPPKPAPPAPVPTP
jgi:Protein of unknown function (DUF1573)